MYIKQNCMLINLRFFLHLGDIMNRQVKISSFLSITPSKRSGSLFSQGHPSKMAKAADEDCKESKTSSVEVISQSGAPVQSNSFMPSVPALTPEQVEKIESNRMAALIRLQENHVNSEKGSFLANIGSSWLNALHEEFSKPYFKELVAFVESERKKGIVYPPTDQVFTWTQMCEIYDVKVVILGQDPYHGPKQAHGLCFSVQECVPPPPSLENMFKELTTDVIDFRHPGHGDLRGWAQQGVLLLNACLTVRAHQPNSHAGKGWEQFTDAVVNWLNINSSGIVFMLWGAYAQKKGSCIDKKRHHILKAVHPSPLSAHRGFFGCKHFSQCNKLLQQSGKTPVDWTNLPRK